jgi:hypothetical protein
MIDYVNRTAKALFNLTIADPTGDTDTKPRFNAYALLDSSKPTPATDDAKPADPPEIDEHTQESRLGRGQFRLLKFRRDLDQPLSCTTSCGDLETAPAYIALSYSWGFVDVSHSIEVDGKDFLVSAAVYTALQSLREQFVFEACDGNVWIDAVAINQKDVVEKTQQVQMMSTIYQKATFVIGWLGELTEHNRRGLQTIKRVVETIGLKEIYDENMNNLIERPSIADAFTLAEQYNLPYLGHQAWEDVATIFEKGWFGRVWVIQELLFAQQFMFLCGDTLIEDDLIHFAASISQIPFLTKAISEARGGGSGHLFAMMLATWREEWVKGIRQNMFSCLLKTMTAQATDPRDKLFAVVSLCNDIGPDIIDYQRDQKEVLIAFALHHFKATAPNIETLLSVPQTFARVEGVPSWVPCWFGGHISGGFALGLGKHSGLRQGLLASQRTKMGIGYIADRLVLLVDSMKLDTIVAILEPHVPDEGVPSIMGLTRDIGDRKYFEWFNLWWRHQVKHLDLQRELADLTEGLGTYPTGEAIEDVYWRSKELPSDTYLTAGEARRRRDLFRGQLQRDATKILTLGTELHSGLAAGIPSWDMLQSGMEYERRVRDYHLCMTQVENDSSIGGVPPSRSYAITKKGYVAWVPTEATIGDELHLIHGARVPYVLKRLDAEEYGSPDAVRIAGDAYVHGLMMGDEIYESGLLEAKSKIDIF